MPDYVYNLYEAKTRLNCRSLSVGLLKVKKLLLLKRANRLSSWFRWKGQENADPVDGKERYA